MKMKKIVVSAVTAVAMFVSSATAFAVDGNQDRNNGEILTETPEEIAEMVGDVTGASDIVQDVYSTNEGYAMDDGDIEIVVPSEGDGEVELTSDDGVISMEFPSDFSGMEGVLTDNGTIVYCSDQEDTALAVQGVQETEDGVTLFGFRSLITINSADAANEYEFKFNLPEGYQLIPCNGGVYVVNNNSMVYDEESGTTEPETVGIIDPAWAKDAHGNELSTEYQINDGTIVQRIEFDENSAFPILADPKYTTIKEYKKTITGTKYDTGKKSTAKKKCEYKIAVYNIVRVPTGKQGKKTVVGKEGRWTWWGYKKVNGKWKYVKKKSGVTRTNKGPNSLNDWYQYLGGLGEF